MGAEVNIYPQYDEDLELKADVNRKGESAECILNSRMDPVRSWISDPSLSRDSLALDRQSSKAKDSIMTSRSRMDSYDRSMLSSSPDTRKRDIWVA